MGWRYPQRLCPPSYTDTLLQVVPGPTLTPQRHRTQRLLLLLLVVFLSVADNARRVPALFTRS